MTRKRYFYFACLGTLFVVFLLFCACKKKTETGTLEGTLNTSSLIPFLLDGDIILRLGDGVLSNRFRDVSLTDKRFSHLGIVRIRNENITIINSVGSLRNRKKGVETVSLDTFLRRARSVGLFRMDVLDGAYISDKALKYVGRPFDWQFDLEEEDSIYCTELLYVILKNTPYKDTLPLVYNDAVKKGVILLDAISNSPYFEEVVYIRRNVKD